MYSLTISTSFGKTDTLLRAKSCLLIYTISDQNAQNPYPIQRHKALAFVYKVETPLTAYSLIILLNGGRCREVQGNKLTQGKGNKRTQNTTRKTKKATQTESKRELEPSGKGEHKMEIKTECKTESKREVKAESKRERKTKCKRKQN